MDKLRFELITMNNYICKIKKQSNPKDTIDKLVHIYCLTKNIDTEFGSILMNNSKLLFVLLDRFILIIEHETKLNYPSNTIITTFNVYLNPQDEDHMLSIKIKKLLTLYYKTHVLEKDTNTSKTNQIMAKLKLEHPPDISDILESTCMAILEGNKLIKKLNPKLITS